MLHDKLRKLKGLEDQESKDAIEKVVEEIAAYELEKYRQVMEDLKKTKHEDKLNTQQFSKLKKKVCSRNQDPPTVMLDKKDNHLTSDKAISERAVEVYVDRLEGNKIKPHLNEMEKDVNKLCEKRLKETKLNKSKPWTLDDLNEAIKSLDKKNK